MTHAHQLVAHLDRNAFESALYYRGSYRVDAVRTMLALIGTLELHRHFRPPMVIIKFPAASATAVQCGGISVVLSCCSTIAGPANCTPTGRQ